MSRINMIENALTELDGGRFQKLAEAYLVRKLQLNTITALGSQPGTDKVCKGIPDAHGISEDQSVLIAFTTAQTGYFNKLKADIDDCVSVALKLSGPTKIVCCHTCWRLTPKQEEELVELAPDVLLIGPKTICEDLSLRMYSDLAADHLGIQLPSATLMTVKDFIAHESASQYVTPQNGLLRGREGDLARIDQLFSAGQRAVIVHGPSGCGKTRLALEVVERLGQAKKAPAYIICSSVKGNEETLLSELEFGPVVVLVDDANDSTNLGPVLEAASRNESLYLVLTARNYAFARLEQRVFSAIKAVSYVVGSLEPEQIDELLSENYDVNNQAVLDRIRAIAKGNLRLAIMAAMQAKRRGLEPLESAHDIMHMFFEKTLSDFSDDEKKVATYVAVYSPIDLVPGDEAFDRMLDDGLNEPAIRRAVSQLFQRDIVDLASGPDGTLGVRFEQQNLRDYLVFQGLIFDKTVSIKDLIERDLTRRQRPSVRSLNIVLGIFGDDKTIGYVRQELLAVWDGLNNDARPARKAFMEMAYQVLPKEAFAYALETLGQVDLSNERAVEWGQYKHTPVGSCELFFRILCSAKGTPRFKYALPYIVDCVRLGVCSIESYKTAIEQILGFDENSIIAGLRDEALLLEKLVQEFETANSSNCGGFLLRLSEKYLSTAIEETRQGEGAVVEFVRSDVPDTEVVRELRAKSIGALCLLLRFEEWAAGASDAILSCIGLSPNQEKLDDAARKRIESDLKALLASLKPPYSMNSNVVKLFVRIKEAVAYFGLSNANGLDDAIPRGAADYWTILRCLEFHEEIPDFARTWTVQRMADVSALAGSFAAENRQMAYEASSVISYMLSCILDNSVLRSGVIASLEAFATDSKGAQIRLVGNAVENAVKYAGHDAVVAFCREFHQEDLELSILFRDSAVKGALADKHRLIELSNKNERILSAEELVSLAGDDQVFAKTYIDSISAELASDVDVAIGFFRMDRPSEKSANDLDLLFGEKTDSLRKLYLRYAGHEHFDFFGAVFLYLWKKDKRIVDDLIASVPDSDLRESRAISRRIGLVSLVPDAYSEMERVVGLIVKRSQIGLAGYKVKSLLESANPFLSRGFDVFNFVLDMVVDHAADDIYVEAFRMVISGFDDAEREKFLIEALSRDRDGKLIGHIPLQASTRSCSAEVGFGPLTRESARAIERISYSLPNEICFVQHRIWLARAASAMRSEAKMEDWVAFHDVW